MSFPKGNVWQEARSLALDAIPIGVSHTFGRPNTLGSWTQAGYFTVSASSSKGYTLVVPAMEFGSALIGNAEYLLDHAAEHQVFLWRAQSSGGTWSPAWLVITWYYWAFFLVLAATRLIGRTAWFVDADVSRVLAAAGAAGRKAGSGTYRVNCGTSVGATAREISLRKAHGRLHDNVWRAWFDICTEWLQKYPSGTGSAGEERAFRAIKRSGDILGREWPSAIRNAINYRPGFGYDAVRRSGRLGRIWYAGH